jgi:ubiquinol oxidase
MVGGMVRHLTSLRTMRRDYGWIHTLLEEAENERMHLLTFLEMRNPGWFMRFMVLVAQGKFVIVLDCNSLVGYSGRPRMF